ncbi:MAG: hypothetical protein WCD70_13420 [Alphaproteobacteria bacterium]
MKKHIFITTLIVGTLAAAIAPPSCTDAYATATDEDGTVRASSFIYDPNMPVVYGKRFIYDPTEPELRGADFRY